MSQRGRPRMPTASTMWLRRSLAAWHARSIAIDRSQSHTGLFADLHEHATGTEASTKLPKPGWLLMPTIPVPPRPGAIACTTTHCRCGTPSAAWVCRMATNAVIGGGYTGRVREDRAAPGPDPPCGANALPRPSAPPESQNRLPPPRDRLGCTVHRLLGGNPSARRPRARRRTGLSLFMSGSAACGGTSASSPARALSRGQSTARSLPGRCACPDK